MPTWPASEAIVAMCPRSFSIILGRNAFVVCNIETLALASTAFSPQSGFSFLWTYPKVCHDIHIERPLDQVVRCVQKVQSRYNARIVDQQSDLQCTEEVAKF